LILKIINIILRQINDIGSVIMKFINPWLKTQCLLRLGMKACPERSGGKLPLSLLRISRALARWLFIIKTFIFIFLINSLFVSYAYAYLDPNAGGFFLQVVIPMVFGAAAAITVFWRRLIGKFINVINKLRGLNHSPRDK
jgi:hypothetical protein